MSIDDFNVDYQLNIQNEEKLANFDRFENRSRSLSIKRLRSMQSINNFYFSESKKISKNQKILAKNQKQYVKKYKI